MPDGPESCGQTILITNKSTSNKHPTSVEYTNNLPQSYMEKSKPDGGEQEEFAEKTRQRFADVIDLGVYIFFVSIHPRWEL